jgi:hypothetical protein
MLAQKCGITTIQLTTSMRKVPGSLTSEPSDDWACLLIRPPAPSKLFLLGAGFLISKHAQSSEGSAVRLPGTFRIDVVSWIVVIPHFFWGLGCQTSRHFSHWCCELDCGNPTFLCEHTLKNIQMPVEYVYRKAKAIGLSCPSIYLSMYLSIYLFIY